MYATISFKAFGGPNTITWQSVPGDESLKAQLLSEALRIERTYSRYRSESIVSRINASAGKSSVSVDAEMAGLLRFAHEMWAQSGGLFDITSGVLRRAWDFKNQIVPSEAALEEVLPLVGWQMVQWSESDIYLPHEGMEIDVGGLGKEYAADTLRSILLEAGVRSALINLGGDVVCLGGGPAGRAWRIGIVHPRRDDRAACALMIQDAALATSGDYERAMIVGGRRYCHILNPKTGQPSVTAPSVSVVASSCLVAGALSTTGMLLSPSKRKEYFADLGVSALVLGEDGVPVERYGAIAMLSRGSALLGAGQASLEAAEVGEIQGFVGARKSVSSGS